MRSRASGTSRGRRAEGRVATVRERRAVGVGVAWGGLFDGGHAAETERGERAAGGESHREQGRIQLKRELRTTACGGLWHVPCLRCPLTE
eukprot:171156-Prymnesium_polylepis.1